MILFHITKFLFYLIFFAAFFTIGITLIRGLIRWNKNNASPILSVDATIVTKRSDVRRYHHTGANNLHNTSYTSIYYITFQIPRGDRIELKVSPSEYGLLADHDTGKLTYQGTRYLRFERNNI